MAQIEIPEDLSSLSYTELSSLADRIRAFLIQSISTTGGHLASNLGVVDLTLLLHKCFDFQSGQDLLLFDTGHQTYTHKILTGRASQFHTLRQWGGLSGFSDFHEHPLDLMKQGHAGTATSVGLGYAFAKHSSVSEECDAPSFRYVVIVVGDAAFSNGISLEAFNTIHTLKSQKIIWILNENQMSISKNVGGVGAFLSSLRLSSYRKFFPFLSRHNYFFQWFYKIYYHMMDIFQKNASFLSSIGVKYLGILDGHSISQLDKVFSKIVQNHYQQPLIVHIRTIKGKGIDEIHQTQDKAEYSVLAEKYHGISPSQSIPHAAKESPIPSSKRMTYTEIFSSVMMSFGEQNTPVIAITCGMTQGVGLQTFAQTYPEHFLDLGIAESHAVAFAAGVSLGGKKPLVAIYSTFLQRAFDQLFQEVSLQEGRVAPLFLLDRAGFVGQDGASHHGTMDIAFLKILPYMILSAPAYEEEFIEMMHLGMRTQAPFAIRIPKDIAMKKADFAFPLDSTVEIASLEIGKATYLQKYDKSQSVGVILAYGSTIALAYEALAKLQFPCIDLVNIRFAKPLDYSILDEVFETEKPILILEEHAKLGGIGETILSYAMLQRAKNAFLHLGIEDTYFSHGTRRQILEFAGLAGESLQQKLTQFFSLHK